MLHLAAVLLCAISFTNAENWAVVVPQGLARADKVAEEHGLLNAGEVIPDSNIFHFKTSSSSGSSSRSKRSVEDIHARLTIHPEVASATHQGEPLKRVKRVQQEEEEPASSGGGGGGEVCFVNTVGTDKSEPRRCVFPFRYRGQTYGGCTADHSSNGKEWCATEVRPDGEVVEGQWGDCDTKALSCFDLGAGGGSSEGGIGQQQPGRIPARPPLPPGFPPQQQQQQQPRRPSQPGGPPFQGGGRFPPQFLPPSFGGRNGPIPMSPFLPPQRQGPMIELVENEVDDPVLQSVDRSSFKVHLNDPSWPKMWFLNRDDISGGEKGLDMNVEDAWAQGYSGKNVTVTILDDGIEHTHEDLKRNYDAEASIDLNDGDKDPFPRYDPFNSNKHGTRCAGTVSASANNSACAVGIAFDSKIGGVRILDGQILDVLEGRALSFNRDHIDIYSASWGPDDNGRTVDGPGELARLALKDGAEKGRSGKGSIFVWASGNGGKALDSCSADGYATSIYTLSISSTSEKGHIPWYSESCSSSMATTYSSGSKALRERKVVTTDLHGECTDQHTGTSASSPMAAGIVALALEANPDLTWRDVQHLTVRTARPQGNLKAGDWSRNGVGLGFSHAYGFGLMDAGEMTRLAKDWERVPEKRNCTAQAGLTQPVVIGPQTEQTVSLDARDCSGVVKFLEHVQLHVNLQTEAKRGDLTVLLRSPDKTVSVLLSPRPLDDVRTGLDDFKAWPMMSVHFWGEGVASSNNSKWLLTVRNGGDRPAILRDFQLTFHGTEEDPQPKKPIKLTAKNKQQQQQQQEPAEVDPALFGTPETFEVSEDLGALLAMEQQELEKEEATTTTKVAAENNSTSVQQPPRINQPKSVETEDELTPQLSAKSDASLTEKETAAAANATTISLAPSSSSRNETNNGTATPA